MTRNRSHAWVESAGMDEALRLHPLWRSFILYCEGLRFGEIEKLQIQDGLPVTAATVKRKIKFDPAGAKPDSGS